MTASWHVHDWLDIADEFTEGILIGNGASIAIDPGFSYPSLLSYARDNKLITERVGKVFEHLKTNDFELVLRIIWHAYHVNQALGIDERETLKAYEDIQHALVQAVRDVHVPYDSAKPYLLPIGQFLSHFDTVASLNYDVVVYWAFLLANEQLGHEFKDCFYQGSFGVIPWREYRNPRTFGKKTTLVFYPHGNLVLATRIDDTEFKVHRDDEGDHKLLDTIIKEWMAGRCSPLFVSEGSSLQKRGAIYRSHYLSTVYNEVIPEIGSKVVILGWSMRDEDHHIFSAIRKGNPTALAISIHTANKTPEEIDQTCQGFIDRLRAVYGRRPYPEIRFFDPATPQCWPSYIPFEQGHEA